MHRAQQLCVALLAGLIGSGNFAIAQALDDYIPANYFVNFGDPGSVEVRLFPRDGKELRVPLPVTLGSATFSPDGKSMYGAAHGSPDRTVRIRGIVRVELKTAQVTPVPDTNDFDAWSLAISPDERHLVVSGSRGLGAGRKCGVFQITLPSGASKQILTTSNCNIQAAWTKLSVSPDGHRLLALHGGRYELISLEGGPTQRMDDKYWMAMWSPDGKRIAALSDYEPAKLLLLDASDLSRTRELGSVDGGLYWSPDSRFLLLYKDQLSCGPSETYSMEILDIQTGERTVPKNSHCAISGGLGGWVSSEIASHRDLAPN